MNEYLILIVEDDKEAVESWKRDITEFNEEEIGVSFEAIYAATRQEATKILVRTKINCAVVDLRLPPSEMNAGDSANPLGNDVLEQLVIETGVPAVVYSAHTADASDLVRKSNIQIRTKKGNGGMEILTYLSKQAGLMSAMDLTRKKISIESARIFNDSIWRRWELTWNQVEDKELLSGMITRQIAAHVSDRLSLPPASHHPDEFYIIPPLFSTRLDTGDLLKQDGKTYVVVTPRCNMANEPYPTQLMLAYCQPVNEMQEWKELKDGLIAGAKREESSLKKLRNYAIQNHSTSTHFIPSCGEEGPWLVDFRETAGFFSAQSSELIKSRFASISTHFVPNLVQRYAAYLGRIGQPDLDPKMLRQQIC